MINQSINQSIDMMTINMQETIPEMTKNDQNKHVMTMPHL